MHLSLTLASLASFALATVSGQHPEFGSFEQSIGLEGALGLQNIEDGVLVDQFGTEYNMADAQVYADLFSPDNFTVSSDGNVTDIRTGDTFSAAVWRATYSNGTVLQIVKDEDGEVSYAEIRHSQPEFDTFFVPSEELSNDCQAMLSFTLNHLDEFSLQSSYVFGEAPSLPSDRLRGRNLLPKFVYRRGDGTSSECTYFKVVRVALLYDGDFCKYYGSSTAARNRIMAVFASASLYYERDLCVKLQLTYLGSPDGCAGPSQTFKNFRRDAACGTQSSNFLSDFSAWIRSRRSAMGINSNSLVHLLTGYPPNNMLGCAWRGTLCSSAWSYGVEYPAFNQNNIVTQSIVMAHEIGHNLNAVHLSASGGEYIMESKLSKGTGGFSASCASRIISFLDSVNCDGVLLRNTFQLAPDPLPTRNPSRQPTIRPAQSSICPTHGDNSQTDAGSCSRNPQACIIAGKQDSFVCLHESDIVSALFGMQCQGTLASASITACDGNALEFLPESAEAEPKKDRSGKNDSGSGSVGEGLKSLSASTCSRSCVVVTGDYVCFSGEQDFVHEVTVRVVDNFGVATTQRLSIPVVMNDTGGCLAAKTKCES